MGVASSAMPAGGGGVGGIEVEVPLRYAVARTPEEYVSANPHNERDGVSVKVEIRYQVYF